MDTPRWRFRTLLVVVALLACVARVEAFPMYDDGSGNGCVSCHNGYKNEGPLHLDHLTKFGITNCGLCHQNPAGGDTPVLTYFSATGFGCAGCHGHDYGETSIHSGQPKATAYGLRRKHAILTPDEGGPITVCASCHYPGSPVTGDPDPAPAIFPETHLPPNYGGPYTNLTDPCSTAQESFDNTIGLDNDGNGAADLDDSACQAFVGSTTTTTVAPATTTTTSTTLPPTGPKRIVLYPGQSIQDAVNAIAPRGSIYVMPGVYTETHPGTDAVTVSKDGIRLIARSRPKQGLKVILQALPGQHNGFVVQPAVANTRINGFRIKGFTIQGFQNNGIITRYLDNFRIENNESIDNLENGIWPTLSANGLVKKNVSYGSQDSAMWVEGSQNVRVLDNELHHSPTGMEVTVSNKILIKRNDVHDNTTGIGLYHPSAAGLPPLQPLSMNGFWDVVGNHVHDNNLDNTAPPGSMAGGLPKGGGILVLGVDNVNIDKNHVENNNFYGVSFVDYCVAVHGTSFDCTQHPPLVTDTTPDHDTVVSNTFVGNGTAPVPFGGFELFAADITYIIKQADGPTSNNCFAKNTYMTLKAPAYPLTISKSCN